MKVLLLGGTGAMGASLTDVLATQGHKVYVTSRRQKPDRENVRYLQGDAHDRSFLNSTLEGGFDAIVDFMVYQTEEFRERAKHLLDSTGQYLFLSSSRVYAGSEAPLTESSPRLLDVCADANYLATDEYALAKAREEDILFSLLARNWTIIRPYITYNTYRLQLAGLEKDIWLRRALNGHCIPLPKDVSVHRTTLTYGEDVAKAIACLIGRREALGEVFHPTGTQSATWGEIAGLYCEILQEVAGINAKLYMPDESWALSAQLMNEYQIRYDRLFDRVFDNSKIVRFIGDAFEFTPIQTGLKKCLQAFLQAPQWESPNIRVEAYLDRTTKERVNFSQFQGWKGKAKYGGFYYIPALMRVAVKAKRCFVR